MLQEVYEFKPSHGYFPGSVKQTDIISTIDACIDFQHILLIERFVKNTSVTIIAPNNFGHKAGTGNTTRNHNITDIVPAIQANCGATQCSYVLEIDKC